MYNEWYDFLVNQLANPMHGIIYLQTTPEMCLKRTQKRARMGEDKISIEYFKQVHTLHEKWINDEEIKNQIKILRLNTDDEFELHEENKRDILDSTKNFILSIMKKN